MRFHFILSEDFKKDMDYGEGRFLFKLGYFLSEYIIKKKKHIQSKMFSPII